jgi:hypothetical protein
LELSVVERIDEDLELHAKKKKLLRLVDAELRPASTLSDNLNALSNQTRSLA